MFCFDRRFRARIGREKLGTKGQAADMSEKESKTSPDGTAPAKALTPAARRALAEADERRRAAAQAQEERPKEINGRDGPEPVRYGDWEVKGIASDF
jgi:hypothetical protein